MNKLLELLSSTKDAKTTNHIRIIYFDIIKSWFKVSKFRNSDSYKQTVDLLNIKAALAQNCSIKHIKLQSSLKTNKVISNYKNKESLEEAHVSLIKKTLLDQHSDLIDAVFIIDILLKEERNIQLKYFIGAVLSVLTIIVSIASIYISLKFQELELGIEMLKMK